MKILAAAAMVVGCSHSKPAIVDQPTAPASPAIPAYETVLPWTASAVLPSLPPPIGAPDLDLLARWPLAAGEHPVGDPTFDIAGALADPGATWQELCRRGVQFRHLAKDQDLIAYLKAWCRLESDPRDAHYQLGLLEHSNVRGIAAAIASDAARIVADRISGDDAEGALRTANLLDAATVDRIAASYAELGKLDDAFAMNELAGAVDPQRSEATVCHRIARSIAYSTDPSVRDGYAAQLHARGTQRTSTVLELHPPQPDPTCAELATAVGCSADDVAAFGSCVAGDATDARRLRQAVRAWPKREASFDAWSTAFYAAMLELPDPRAIAIAERALALEISTSQCRRTTSGSLSSMRGGYGSRSPPIAATKPTR